MKKGAKIALSAAAVLVLAGGGIAAWQWNNLTALRYGVTMDSQALEEKLEENHAVLEQAMGNLQIDQYEFTEEEVAQLVDNSLSAKEAAQKLLEQAAPAPTTDLPDSQTPTTGNPEQPEEPAAPAPAVSPEEQEIKALLAQMYVLRATYQGKLDMIVQSAIEEYANGEHTSENRTKVVYGKMGELVALESDCDAQVAAVVKRLRELLKATGQDDTLARQVETTYQEEKSLKKGYYINEFRNG